MNKKIKIDSEKCVGCGICAKTCKQSAIEMVNGKAVVTNGESCDKIGNCLPVCPVNAISLTETGSFTETNSLNKTGNSSKNDYMKVVSINIFKEKSTKSPYSKPSFTSWCQEDSNLKKLYKNNLSKDAPSMLRQWPVQIKLVLENAIYFENADLLIAADCSAYSYANFHQDFMNDKVTIIGCPKLDEVDYTQKLTNIITNNNIKSLTVVRMEVPCCGGIENASRNALKTSGKIIPFQIVTLSTDGKIVEK